MLELFDVLDVLVPLGGALLGLVLVVVGVVLLVVAAFRVSPGWGLACLAVPFAAPVFIAHLIDFDELAALSRDAVARPLVADPNTPDVTLVLNGAFLVERSRLPQFRSAVAERVRAYQPRGLTFDFTGPWPPYNFTRAKAR